MHAHANRDNGTSREHSRQRRRLTAVAAACGDPIVIDVSERCPKRMRAKERHRSPAYPSYDLAAAMRGRVIQPNPAFKPTFPIFNNVVATARCMLCVPDTQRLAWTLGGLRTTCEFARPVTITAWPEGATIAIQTTTGILNLTGNKSSDAAVLACHAYIEAVARYLCIPLMLAEFDVFNAQATFRVGGCIDLAALHRAVPQSNYERELISCVTITIREPRATVLVWGSGAVVVNGCSKREDHMRIYHEFGLFLSQFVRPSGNTVAVVTTGDADGGDQISAPVPSALAAPVPESMHRPVVPVTAAQRVFRRPNGRVGLRPYRWGAVENRNITEASLPPPPPPPAQPSPSPPLPMPLSSPA